MRIHKEELAFYMKKKEKMSRIWRSSDRNFWSCLRHTVNITLHHLSVINYNQIIRCLTSKHHRQLGSSSWGLQINFNLLVFFSMHLNLFGPLQKPAATASNWTCDLVISRSTPEPLHHHGRSPIIFKHNMACFQQKWTVRMLKIHQIATLN